jgi:general L-amino acid transport system substrate-binding protein
MFFKLSIFDMNRLKLVVLALLAVLPLAACDSGAKKGETAKGTIDPNSTLSKVLQRGKLICGVEGTIPGFSNVDSQGNYSGLDVDYCKAVAAAVLGDPNKVEYRNLNSSERFTALNAGEVDMLSRNTTWTASRDARGGNGLEFAPTTFYDGQGVMVGTASGIKDFKGLDGKSVCVETGTTTELNLADKARAENIKVNEVKFDKSDATYAAFAQGRCEAVTSDRSQLAAYRTKLPNPDSYILLDAVLSKEPLGPVTKDNDSDWFDVVKWVTYVPMQAEEFKITQANVKDQLNTTNPEIKRFLGVEGDLGKQLGLPNDYVVKVIEAVGNAGEIYERNVGEQSALKLPRGYNNLWTNGGLMYSPPFR